MCLIIDINIFHKVLKTDPEFKPICTRLKRSTIELAYGGKLAEEYFKDNDIKRYLVKLDQAGVAKKYNKKDVNDETAHVKAMKSCVSDDEHIIALARISGARILCSRDTALQKDFQNKKLIDNPRGSIYKRANHEHLLEKCSKCLRNRS